MAGKNFVTIKLSDYSDYMHTHHLRAVRSGWNEGKPSAFVDAAPLDDPRPVTLSEQAALTEERQPCE